MSLILCNTEKGRLLFEAIKNRMDVVPAELENVVQTSFVHPHKQSPYCDAFEKDYAVHGFEHSMKKFSLMGWKYQFVLYKQKIRLFKNSVVNIFNFFKCNENRNCYHT